MKKQVEDQHGSNLIPELTYREVVSRLTNIAPKAAVRRCFSK